LRELIKEIVLDYRERIPTSIVRREYEVAELLKDHAFNRIISIVGVRRVGKTYLLFQTLRDLGEENAIYINFEDERIPRDSKFLTELIPTLIEMLGDRRPFYLLLDEIHSMPKWSLWLRRIHDFGDAKIVITGSSSKLLSKEIATELRGRSHDILLLPLSFKEFLRFKGLEIKKRLSSVKRAILMRYLSEYLEYGGLPEVVLASPDRKIFILQDYFRTIVYRDIVERHKVRDLKSVLDILKILLNSTIVSYSRVYNILKSKGVRIGKEKVIDYINYAEESLFLYLVPIYVPKLSSQIVYPKKVYFADNGFIRSISTRYGKEKWRLLENLVFLELLRRIKDRPLANIYYWKSNEYEVDFVVEELDKIKCAVQVAWSLDDYDVRKREVRSLERFMRKFGVANGVIITYDEEEMIRERGVEIKVVPILKVLLDHTEICEI